MPRFEGDFLFCWTAIGELLQTLATDPRTAHASCRGTIGKSRITSPSNKGRMILCLLSSVKRNSKLFRALLHFLVLMATAAPALAQVYKWVDERGVTHYGERPPQGRNASEVPNKLGSPAPEGTTAQPKDQEPRQGQPRAEKAEDRHKQEETRRREQCN